MYQVGQVSDHVHRSYKEHNRWMYVPEVREPFTAKKLKDALFTILVVVGFAFSLCTLIAMIAASVQI